MASSHSLRWPARPHPLSRAAPPGLTLAWAPSTCPWPVEASHHCQRPTSAPLLAPSCLEAQWVLSAGPSGICLCQSPHPLSGGNTQLPPSPIDLPPLPLGGPQALWHCCPHQPLLLPALCPPGSCSCGPVAAPACSGHSGPASGPHAVASPPWKPG